MNSSKSKGVGLVALAFLAGALAVAALRPPYPMEQVSPQVSAQPSDRPTGTAQPAGIEPIDETSVDQKISLLEARLAEQSTATSLLQVRLDELSAEIAAIRTDAAAAPALIRPEVASPHPAAPPRARQTVDYSKSAMQRALEAAGLDAETAEGIKLHGDQLAMTEMYLRDQATREGWLDSQRFREEMEAIDEQRTSIRDDLGDDGYDRYLFALGHTNRVIVNDVMFDSVAEDVGLQTGDLIISYGETRVFAPDELSSQTRAGTAGDPITVEVVRNGKRFDVEVPRGPLGVRIGVAQDDPDAS